LSAASVIQARAGVDWEMTVIQHVHTHLIKYFVYIHTTAHHYHHYASWRDEQSISTVERVDKIIRS